MRRNPRYDVLFDPVRIGPVTTRNRFYQVPHASSTGQELPNIRAGLRSIRAEGGWGVVCTGYCSIHPSSDDAPHRYSRLWDDEDIRNLSVMTDAVHKHGALAGVELYYGSSNVRNIYTREISLSPSGVPINTTRGDLLLHSRAMDKSEIRALRGWQIDADKRAKNAGFDIIYIYCGMRFGPYQFLSQHTNHRSDEYGGSIENRVRLLREMIEDTKNAVGDSCAVAVRFSTDELMGPLGMQWEDEGMAVLELVGELPDLWDLKTFGFEDSSNSRYSDEGYQEPYVVHAKKITSKPIVGVGRFTSPDSMVSQVSRGVLDLIGAARPSIADPFLPNKIDTGREDEIRECIGCNICYSCFHEAVPIRCTQNPTMGEEWRRGWHPERIDQKISDDSVLVVGAGPAGMEAARALGQRGYSVILAEMGKELGGRLLTEARLPGLSSWIRVRDWRLDQINRLPNVEIYLDSRLDENHILEFGFPRVVLATGASWSAGLADQRDVSLPIESAVNILTPDDILGGFQSSGTILVYDYDHYYMASCLAEQLAMDGLSVIYVTPADRVSSWSVFTHDQWYAQKKLLELGCRVLTGHYISAFDGDAVTTECKYTAHVDAISVDHLLVVGARTPNLGLYEQLLTRSGEFKDAGVDSLARIGDCDVPGAVVHAVYSGHRFAREFDEESHSDQIHAVERAQLF